MVGMNDTATRARVSKISQRMFDVAARETVPSRQRSQLWQVAHDLCDSVCTAAALRDDRRFFDDGLVGDFVEEHSERVGVILSAIPSAFHHWVFKDSDGREVQPFDMNVAEMTEAANRLTDAKAEDVVKAYGTIWTHVRAMSEIRPDAQSKFKRESFLNPIRDGVEYVANLYLAADDLVSPLLEWAVVDALMLDRITEFAAACSFAGNLPEIPDGQLLEGPLLPGAKRLSMGMKALTPLQGLGLDLAKIGVKLFFELVALGVSWLVSEFLAGSEGLAKWILFSAITAARWVVMAVKGGNAEDEKEDSKGETNLRMLWDMGIAHERAPAMNVGLLRHLLYRLEERGAAFNPAIYATLDKRARREAAKR